MPPAPRGHRLSVRKQPGAERQEGRWRPSSCPGITAGYSEENGVRGYSFEQCWDDYRLAVMHLFLRRS
jgi:hypothetical protein